MRAINSTRDVHGITYTEKRTKRIERAKKVQKIQEAAENKKTGYYDKRGLTQVEQTGEITSNISLNELFEMEKAKSKNSKAYTDLHKSEKDKVREFKSEYKQKEINESNNIQNKDEEVKEIEQQEEDERI